MKIDASNSRILKRDQFGITWLCLNMFDKCWKVYDEMFSCTHTYTVLCQNEMNVKFETIIKKVKKYKKKKDSWILLNMESMKFLIISNFK